jgi:O-antigen/teichoic acid export membrane protein
VAKKKNIFRDVLGVFSSNVVTMVFGLATSIIMTRALGPELKGEYTTLLVIPGIVGSFVMFGSRPSIIYHISQGIFSKQQVVSALIFLYLTSCLVGSLIFINYYWLVIEESYSHWILIFVLLYIPSKLLNAYISSIFLANQEFKKANQLKWLTAFLTFLLFFLVVFLLKYSLIGAFLSLLLGSVLVSGYAVFLMVKEYHLKLEIDFHVINSIIQLGFVNALALVVIQLNFRVDIIIMNFLSTKQEIGYYALGVSITEKLWQLPFAVGVVLTSISAASKNRDELIDDVARSLRITFIIILIACIFLYFFTPILIPFLFGIPFEKSVIIIQSILPGTLFFVIVRILSSSLAGLGKPKIILLVFIPALMLNIILNLIWIPRYGGVGAAWATNISYTMGALTLLFIYARISKTHIKKFITFEQNDFRLWKFKNEWKKMN